MKASGSSVDHGGANTNELRCNGERPSQNYRMPTDLEAVFRSLKSVPGRRPMLNENVERPTDTRSSPCSPIVSSR